MRLSTRKWIISTLDFWYDARDWNWYLRSGPQMDASSNNWANVNLFISLRFNCDNIDIIWFQSQLDRKRERGKDGGEGDGKGKPKGMIDEMKGAPEKENAFFI